MLKRDFDSRTNLSGVLAPPCLGAVVATAMVVCWRWIGGVGWAGRETLGSVGGLVLDGVCWSLVWGAVWLLLFGVWTLDSTSKREKKEEGVGRARVFPGRIICPPPHFHQ